MRLKINWHALGISASLICAIHCAVAPLLLSSLPLFGVNIIENQWVEFILLGTAFIIGFITLRHGYRNHHRRKIPLILFSLGMICFIMHQFYDTLYGIWLLVIPGVAAIIAAHLLNYHYCGSVHNCHH
jgi:hypothetical protein